MRIKKLSIGLLGGAAILATLAFTTVKASKDQAKHPVEFDSALVMTPQVSAIVTRACADCHSMTPHLPWYANVPPASWMIQQDIVKARKAVNLTTWSQQNGKTAGSAIGTLAAMCADVQSARMPDRKYIWMHPNAQLTPTEVSTFCGWTVQQMARSKPARATHSTLR